MTLPSPKPRAWRGPLLPIAAAVLAAGALQLARSGYSVDEEFTVFAVRGISAHGLPLLPSNLLYDRGIAYSYASWAAHALTGFELPAYRAIGLTCAVIALWHAWVLVARRAHAAATTACALMAVSVPFWAVATSGRFYAPFLALYLATVAAMPSSLVAMALLAFVCRLAHELAFTLAFIPAVCVVVDRRQRRQWLLAGVTVVVGLVAAQAMLFALHALAPSSGETMVKRFFLWQVLNLFQRPGAGQFTVPLAVMVLGWLAVPSRAWQVTVTAVSLAAMVLAFSLAQASNAGPLTVDAVRTVVFDGSRYPLDMFWHLVAHTPLTVLIAFVLLSLRMAGAGGEWTLRDRALHGLWLGWVLWFGVIDSGITTNYLLLPVSFMMIAIAVDAHAILLADGVPARRYFSAPGRSAYASVMGLVLIVAIDQWRTSLDQARPTISAPGIDAIARTLQPNDRVVCTDELGCLMLVGRIDRWLALDDYVRERFLVRRGDGPVTGVYTGVPAVFRPGDLFGANADGTAPGRIVIVDVFKEYPIGNSSAWLPRALAQDGLQAVPLLETPQLRVLELSAPEAFARVAACPPMVSLVLR